MNVELDTQIAERLRAVLDRMARAAERAGRDPGSVTLVAVTKTVPLDRIESAVRAGVRVVGENRVQEAQEKMPVLHERFPDVLRHFIGHLQTNKVRGALELFDVVESVDSLHLAHALDRRAADAGRVVPILLEVNIGREATKHGFMPEDLPAAADELTRLAHVRVEGLMTVAPPAEDAEDVRPVFRGMRQLRDELAARYTRAEWHELSMGMSDDFDVAIEEGATLVRLGRALFGPRA